MGAMLPLPPALNLKGREATVTACVQIVSVAESSHGGAIIFVGLSIGGLGV